MENTSFKDLSSDESSTSDLSLFSFAFPQKFLFPPLLLFSIFTVSLHLDEDFR